MSSPRYLDEREPLHPGDQKFFSRMVEDLPEIEVIVVGSKEGYYIIFKTFGKRWFELQTQRKSTRFFKSPSTLINFLAEVGVKNICMENIHLCGPDTYVKKNSARNQKRIAKITQDSLEM